MNSQLKIAAVLFTLLTMIASRSAFSAEVYSNTFDSGTSFSEWSHNVFSITPVGSRRFLGEFDDRTVTLTLSGLPTHDIITLSFDFFALRTGGGVGPDAANNTGPDRFVLSIANGPTLLDTTFSNGGPSPYDRQNYPDASNPALPIRLSLAHLSMAHSATLRTVFKVWIPSIHCRSRSPMRVRPSRSSSPHSTSTKASRLMRVGDWTMLSLQSCRSRPFGHSTRWESLGWHLR